MDAVYDFHLPPVGETIAASIVERDRGVHVLDAQLWGRRTALTTATLAGMLVTYPFMTLKTTAAIHVEALRLYLKGVPHYPRPHRIHEQP